MSDFQSTLWTVIWRAGEGRETAVNVFVARYRPAVVRFARSRGLSEADAEDVAQEVFLRLFDDEVLKRADPARGRFRSMLLAITRHVLGHFFERRGAVKRGGGATPVSLERAGDAPWEVVLAREERDPEFDREFVSCLLASAMRRLREETPAQYEAIHAFLVEERPQRDIAGALDRTEASIRNAVLRGKVRLGQIVRELVEAYASSREELETELAWLAPYLGQRARGG